MIVTDIEPGTYERTVTVEGVEVRRRTVAWRTEHGTVAAGRDYFIGKTYLTERFHGDFFPKVDAAIKEQFGE